MSAAQRDRIVQILGAKHSPLRTEGVGILVDRILDGRPGEVLDLNAGRDVVLGALTEANLRTIIGRHVAPGWVRFGEVAERSEETLGGFVPEEARERIRRIVLESRLPEAKWADGMVDPALIRKLFAPVWVNLLLAFARKLPMPGAGVAGGAAAMAGSAVGGIAGRLSRGAEKIMDAGRSVVGGLGAEVERRMQAAAREFSEGAADLFRQALVDRVKSDEGRALVEQIAGQVIDHLMVTRIADLHAETKQVPVDQILDVVPLVVGHSVRRAFVRGIVDREIAAFLEASGTRTFRELLDELGMLDEVRAIAVRKVDELARDLFGSSEFGDWIARVLSA